MRRRAWTAPAVFAAVLALAGGAAAITNGTVDGSAHPNVGALYATADGHPVPTQFCSGSLVAPGVFVTAAHCVEAINGAPNPHFLITFAPNPGPAPDPSTLIEGTATSDPQYGLSATWPDPHDIAVIRFRSRAARGIQPVTLPRQGFLDAVLAGRHENESVRRGERRFASPWTTKPRVAARGKGGNGGNNGNGGYGNGGGGNGGNNQQGWPDRSSFSNVGYGLTDVNADRDGIRRKSVSGDPKLHGSSWLVLSQLVAKGFGGTCYGDSGGPQFYRDVQVSITITGDDDCLVEGVNLRLDTSDARDFLRSQGVLDD